MYSAEYLARYPFFRELLETTPLSVMHDSLTGLIARPYILRFVHALIDDKTPFVMGMVDLDNFKSINDNYGHRTGDRMLSTVAEDLRVFVGEDGVVGRFGGDEFLFVYFGCTDYDGIHAFLDEMYLSGRVFRKDLKFGERTIFSTATVGCAVYPTDADSFDALFALSDKTLYRGKSKGRNCFIISFTSRPSTTSWRSPPSPPGTSTIPFTARREPSTRAATPESGCAAASPPSARACACTGFSTSTRKSSCTTSPAKASSARSNHRTS